MLDFNKKSLPGTPTLGSEEVMSLSSESDLELNEEDKHFEQKKIFDTSHHSQPKQEDKLTQAKLALIDAIHLGGIQDPNQSLFKELIYTLDTILASHSRTSSQGQSTLIRSSSSPSIDQIQKDIEGIHQKLDLLLEEKDQAKSIQDFEDKPVHTPPSYAQITKSQRPQKPVSSIHHSYTQSLHQPLHQSFNQPLNQTLNEALPVPKVVIPIKKDLDLKEYSSLETASKKYPKESDSQSWTKVESRKKHQKQLRQSSRISRDRRLILTVPLDFLDSFNPKILRDSINDEFLKMGLMKAVVAGITKSVSNLSLVLTTLPEIQAQFLIDHLELWKQHIPILKLSIDQKWARVVVHRVPWKAFDYDDGLTTLKHEIETFNPSIRLARDPQWLRNEESRCEKLHTSIVIHLANMTMAEQAVQDIKLHIAGEECRVERFFDKFIQCEKCQGYGHTRIHCKKEARCGICANNHLTLEHSCSICQIKGRACPHTKPKCINCNQIHQANSKSCSEWIRVQPRSRPFYQNHQTHPISHQQDNELDIQSDIC